MSSGQAPLQSFFSVFSLSLSLSLSLLSPLLGSSEGQNNLATIFKSCFRWVSGVLQIEAIGKSLLIYNPNSVNVGTFKKF